MQAVNLVRQGWSIRKTARYFGVYPSTVSRWIKKDRCYGLRPIPTESSRPLTHPKALSENIVKEILKIRDRNHRCSEVVHQELLNKGVIVSLSSVKRVLKRHSRIKQRSPWKRWHFEEKRPLALKPGDLVQVDTVHFFFKNNLKRFYIYTLLDVCSRWATAKASLRINTHLSLEFVKEAQELSSFPFSMLQSDHGSEFSAWFTEHMQKQNISHRHSRIRKPSDNGHLERFNRTIQEECLRKLPFNFRIYQKEIPRYLKYYNTKRLHLGLNLKTPQQVLRSY